MISRRCQLSEFLKCLGTDWLKMNISQAEVTRMLNFSYRVIHRLWITLSENLQYQEVQSRAINWGGAFRRSFPISSCCKMIYRIGYKLRRWCLSLQITLQSLVKQYLHLLWREDYIRIDCLSENLLLAFHSLFPKQQSD